MLGKILTCVIGKVFQLSLFSVILFSVWCCVSKLTAEALKLFMVLSTVHLWLIKGHPTCKFPFFVCLFLGFFLQVFPVFWSAETFKDVEDAAVGWASPLHQIHQRRRGHAQSYRPLAGRASTQKIWSEFEFLPLLSLLLSPAPLSLYPLLFVLCNRNSSFWSPRIRLSYRFCSVLNSLWQQIDLINAQFIFKKCHIWLLSKSAIFNLPLKTL